MIVLEDCKDPQDITMKRYYIRASYTEIKELIMGIYTNKCCIT